MNKLIALVLLYVTCITFTSFAQECGDVNNDGAINILDALLIARYYVGLNPSNFNLAEADANDDGGVSIVDALVISHFYVGLIAYLPCNTPTPTPSPTFTPSPTPDPTQTPVPTEIPGTGEVWLEADINTKPLYISDPFKTQLYVDVGFHTLTYYEINITFDPYIVEPDTSIGNNGVEVEPSSEGFVNDVIYIPGMNSITVIGGYTASTKSEFIWHLFTINWKAIDSGTTYLVPYVNDLRDLYDVSLPYVFDTGIVTVIILADTPTPSPVPTLTPNPTPIPTATPTPDPYVTPTPSPVPTPDTTQDPDAGKVWIEPSDIDVYQWASFTTDIYVNTGIQSLAEYNIRIAINTNTIIAIDTSVGINGVEAGVDGFLNSVNLNSGIDIEIVGNKPEGINPGERIHLITLHWKVISDLYGINENIYISPYILNDISDIPVGYPIGEGTTVEILYSTIPPTPSPTPTTDPQNTPTPTPTSISGETPLPTISPVPTPDFTSLKCEIIWHNLEEKHFIPNTDKGLMFQIKITKPNDTLLGDVFDDIMILAPVDPNWENNDDTNINRNKGGNFKLYISGISPELMTFVKDDSITGIGYHTEYNTTFFTSRDYGILREEFELTTQNTSTLNFIDINNDYAYAWFIIKTDSNPRPGDDLRLRFKLSNYNIEGTVDPCYFMSVYDKKLLWRAQLFIDETKNADGTASGNADWNNENRWTHANGNEWDKDWFDYNGNGIYDEAGPYNGGQCDIKPWTSIYTYFPAHEAWAIQRGYPLEVHNAVAYSLGCDDTPYFFNMDMVEQKDALRTYYNTNNTTQVIPNPAPTEHPGWATWNDTVAPGDEWGNYIRGNPELTNSVYSITASGGTTYYPYTTGFSSYRRLFNLINNPDQSNIADFSPEYIFQQTKYSAGVECQGLITRSAGYSGNNYVLDQELDSTRRTWTVTTGAGIDINNWLNVSWVINDITDEQTSLAIPGDVIMINGHVGIIYKINYNQNRLASDNQVFFIEAFGTTMATHKERTWRDLRDDTQNETFLNLVRLRTQ